MRLAAVKLVALLGVAGLTAVACGGDDSGSSSSATTAGGAAVTTAASTGTTGAGAAITPPSGKPWVIAAVAPFSGAQASFYTVLKPAFEGAAKWLNENKGGIAGRPVRIDYVDNAGQPAQGVSALQSYLDKNTPDMVIPGPTSAMSLPILPLLTQAKVFSTANTASAALSDPSKYPYHFPVTPTTDQIMDAVVTYAGKQGYKKLAFLAPDNASGRGALDSIKKSADAKGVGLASAFMDPTLLDATAQMSQLKAANPDVLVLDGFGPTAGVFLKTKTKLKWDIPTIADETLANADLGQFASEEDLKGVQMQFFDFSIKDDPASQTPLAKFLLKELSSVKTSNAFWGTALTWNDVIAGAIAGDIAGPNADGPALAKALESVQEIPDKFKDTWFGSPKLGFSATNHTPLWSDAEIIVVPAGKLDGGLAVVPK